MNFLAHLHLSDGTPGSMTGGIVADFMKPPEIALLPADIRAGVRLHQLIDGFTDRHPVVQRSIGRLSGTYHWFSGIIVDIYYDHILARDWPRYAAEPLRVFADRSYRALDGLLPVVSETAAGFIRSFIENDLMVTYGTTDGITETLSRVSDRIARRMPRNAMRLEAAMPALHAADAHFANDFHAFYPELVAFAERSRSSPPV